MLTKNSGDLETWKSWDLLMITGLNWLNEDNMLNLHEFTISYQEKMWSWDLLTIAIPANKVPQTFPGLRVPNVQLSIDDWIDFTGLFRGIRLLPWTAGVPVKLSLHPLQRGCHCGVLVLLDPVHPNCTPHQMPKHLTSQLQKVQVCNCMSRTCGPPNPQNWPIILFFTTWTSLFQNPGARHMVRPLAAWASTHGPISSSAKSTLWVAAGPVTGEAWRIKSIIYVALFIMTDLFKNNRLRKSNPLPQRDISTKILSVCKWGMPWYTMVYHPKTPGLGFGHQLMMTHQAQAMAQQRIVFPQVAAATKGLEGEMGICWHFTRWLRFILNCWYYW